MTTKTAESQNFETELKSTELGDFILRYKTIAILLILAILAGIVAGGVISHLNKKKEQATADALYLFEESALKDFQADKLTSAKLVEELNTIKAKFNSPNALMTTSLFVFDALVSKDTKEAKADALNVVKDLESQNNYQKFLINPRLALAYELNGNNDAAIKALEELVATGLKVNEGKIYIDLGRLYMVKGNKEMAKKSFDYVKTINTESVFKSLADFYLGSL